MTDLPVEQNVPGQSAHAGGRWCGPFQIRELIESCDKPGHPVPPTDNGVYVVTDSDWTGDPARSRHVLYVGGTTSPNRFRTRVGELVTRTIGYFGDDGPKHSGGRSLYRWCRSSGFHPLDLWLGWLDGVECRRCAEVGEYLRLRPLLNKKFPGACPDHIEARRPPIV